MNEYFAIAHVSHQLKKRCRTNETAYWHWQPQLHQRNRKRKMKIESRSRSPIYRTQNEMRFSVLCFVIFVEAKSRNAREVVVLLFGDSLLHDDAAAATADAYIAHSFGWSFYTNNVSLHFARMCHMYASRAWLARVYVFACWCKNEKFFTDEIHLTIVASTIIFIIYTYMVSVVLVKPATVRVECVIRSRRIKKIILTDWTIWLALAQALHIWWTDVFRKS